MTEKELKIRLDRWFSRNWEHYESEVRKNIANGQMSKYAHDLCILIYETFMKKPHAYKQQVLENDKILNWMLRASAFQLKSGTSPFYRQFRKHSVKHIPEYFAINEGKGGTYEIGEWSNDAALQCVMEAIKEENIGFYYSRILEMKFLKQMTYSEMCDEYGFALNTLKKDIILAMEEVKKYCNHL